MAGGLSSLPCRPLHRTECPHDIAAGFPRAGKEEAIMPTLEGHRFKHPPFRREKDQRIYGHMLK